MKKNSEIHLKLETEFFEKLKAQATEERITISELCRMKLSNKSRFERIEMLIIEVIKKLENVTK